MLLFVSNCTFLHALILLSRCVCPFVCGVSCSLPILAPILPLAISLILRYSCNCKLPCLTQIFPMVTTRRAKRYLNCVVMLNFLNLCRNFQLFKQRCSQCHVADSPATKTGPTLQGIIGRTSGQIKGFDYSSANKHKGEIETIAPGKIVPTIYTGGN